ncbi:hypothetical protein LZK73_21795 [Neorhizobium galegae]|nr:hypothetical protein LZK73_21795 [Neorhizobium galegae]
MIPFLLWLLAGVILMTALIVKDVRIGKIENRFSRRYVMILVTVICMPAFIALSAADHFMQWAEQGISPGEAVKRFFHEIGPGFLNDLKEAW